MIDDWDGKGCFAFGVVLGFSLAFILMIIL